MSWEKSDWSFDLVVEGGGMLYLAGHRREGFRTAWQIRVSDDGGHSWQIQDNLKSAYLRRLLVGPQEYAFAAGAMVASDNSTHWIVRRAPLGSGVWETVDIFPATPGVSTEARDVVVTGDVVIAIGNATSTAGDPTGFIRRSVDGGRHWNQVYTFPGEATAITGEKVGSLFIAHRAGALYVVARNGDTITLHKSENGGETWKRIGELE